MRATMGVAGRRASGGLSCGLARTYGHRHRPGAEPWPGCIHHGSRSAERAHAKRRIARVFDLAPVGTHQSCEAHGASGIAAAHRPQDNCWARQTRGLQARIRCHRSCRHRRRRGCSCSDMHCRKLLSLLTAAAATAFCRSLRRATPTPTGRRRATPSHAEPRATLSHVERRRATLLPRRE